MKLEILKYPDPRLARPSEEIREITPQLRELARDMLETMYAAEGVGLAAPQIGRNIRLLVMDEHAAAEQKTPRVFVNPRLELSEETVTSENEGCLSVPLNFRADVMRACNVRVRAMDIDGNPIDERLEGLAAIIIQHETDHLDGKLFIDKISRLRRNIYDGKVKKWQREHA